MQKDMLYDEKDGWYWHKSWNIPIINVITDVISDV